MYYFRAPTIYNIHQLQKCINHLVCDYFWLKKKTNSITDKKTTYQLLQIMKTIKIDQHKNKTNIFSNENNINW